ncbi:MAG: co-chaperone GroES [Chloroflexi bacterium]|nr:co-chaperone GroES [Chloroflexota bacterium]
MTTTNKAKLKVKPLADRVVISPSDDAASQSPGGIYIPDTAKEKPQTGAVVAAGPGRVNDEGKTIPMSVKVGDSVIYSKYAGTEYTEEGVEYLVVRESDILATI